MEKCLKNNERVTTVFAMKKVCKRKSEIREAILNYCSITKHRKTDALERNELKGIATRTNEKR